MHVTRCNDGFERAKSALRRQRSAMEEAFGFGQMPTWSGWLESKKALTAKAEVASLSGRYRKQTQRAAASTATRP